MNAQSGFEKLSLHFLLTLKFSLQSILLIWCLKVNSSLTDLVEVHCLFMGCMKAALYCSSAQSVCVCVCVCVV